MLINEPGTVFTSPDGINWGNSASGLRTTYSCTFGNNRFVAGGGTSYSYVYNSSDGTDGITWSRVTTPSGGVFDIIYADNQFVACSDSGHIMTSPNGSSDWIKRASGTSSRLNAT